MVILDHTNLLNLSCKMEFKYTYELLPIFTQQNSIIYRNIV